MFQQLPWEIQKIILQFEFKHELHKELKKEVNIYIKIKNIQNQKFKRFLKDCIRISTLSEEIEWYIWMMQLIFDGERPWYYIRSEHAQLISYLKMCRNLRFGNRKKYGFSIKSWIRRLSLV